MGQQQAGEVFCRFRDDGSSGVPVDVECHLGAAVAEDVGHRPGMGAALGSLTRFPGHLPWGDDVTS
jgi:hypothetical protein